MEFFEFWKKTKQELEMLGITSVADIL